MLELVSHGHLAGVINAEANVAVHSCTLAAREAQSRHPQWFVVDGVGCNRVGNAVHICHNNRV